MDLSFPSSRGAAVPPCRPGSSPEIIDPWSTGKRRSTGRGARAVSKIVMPPVLAAHRPRTPAAIQEILPALRSELDRLGLKRVRLGLEAGADWQGAFAITGDGALEIVIGASLDPMKTLHHEVIHALKHLDLFTTAEWTALERAAVSGWIERHQIDTRYPDLTWRERVEEAIAEAFAEHQKTPGSGKPSPIARAFDKIARLLLAFRNALAGAGFRTAAEIFERVHSGEISARQNIALHVGPSCRTNLLAMNRQAGGRSDDRDYGAQGS